MKKKVLYLITKATWGGAQRYVFDLATNLPKEKYEPYVAFGEAGRLSEELSKAGIQTRHIPSLARDVALISDIKSLFEILQTLRDVQPDIVHLNSSKAAALGALAARIVSISKIMFTVHGWPFREQRGSISRALLYVVSWLTALLSHTVIAVSVMDEMQGKRMYGIGTKIHHITTGMRPPDFLSREEAARALAVSAPPPRIVTVAELTANKGIRYALEALADLKLRGTTFSYFIIGDGEERSALERKAGQLGIVEQVHFLGFVADASRYLKAFDAFLLPSLKEGMPYAILEAAFAELPIVVTSAVATNLLNLSPGVPKVIPGNVFDLVRALEKALDPAVEKPPQNAKLVFAFEPFIEKTLALYEA